MFNQLYSRYYDLFNDSKPYEKEIKFVYEWAGKPDSIFDIGCGTADYWKYYPKETHIIGIEKSRSMIQKSKQVICADITQYKYKGKFDCATALFDVLNYIPTHEWWKNIPLEKGGYFIFDIFNKKKVELDGFVKTTKANGTAVRIITPLGYDGKSVRLNISVFEEDIPQFEEVHQMYIYSKEDIERFCGKEFKVVEVKDTEHWQQWWKLQRV